MNSLKKFKNKLNNCSRCGLCQAVCPIYDITKNDCNVLKGKCTLLKELLNGKTKPTKTFSKYINTCLNCEKCTKYCPSKINVTEIKSAFNEDFSKQSIFTSNLFFNLIFSVIFVIINIYRFLKLDKIVDKFFYKILRLGNIGKNLLIFNSMVKINITQNKQRKVSTPKLKVLYFQSCMSKYVNPSQKNAIFNILNNNEIEVVKENFKCCGKAQYQTGNINKYKKLEKYNLKILNNQNYDYVIFDCISCLNTVLKYPNINSEKFIMVEELYNDILQDKIKENIKIAYHKPCLQTNTPKILLKTNCINVTDKCCGNSVSMIANPTDISKNIADKAIDSLLKNNPDIIVTDCNFCKYGIIKTMMNKKISKPVLSISEYINL